MVNVLVGGWYARSKWATVYEDLLGPASRTLCRDVPYPSKLARADARGSRITQWASELVQEFTYAHPLSVVVGSDARTHATASQ